MAPSKASRQQLQRFHSQDYIHFLETHGNQSDSEEDEETAQEMEEYGLGVHASDSFWDSFAYVVPSTLCIANRLICIYLRLRLSIVYWLL